MNATSASAILQVSDIGEAVSFYCDVLDFAREFAYGEPPFYAGIRMNDVILHLNAGTENVSRLGLGSVCLFCDEVDEYDSMVRENGTEITSPLNSYPYGMRDFQTKDPDGNLICFGCRLESDGTG